MARNPVSWILLSVKATTILLASPSNILQPKTNLLQELHFTNTFHDQNLYIFAFKMLLIILSDMLNFAVTTKREHWSKKSEKLSPFLSAV